MPSDIEVFREKYREVLNSDKAIADALVEAGIGVSLPNREPPAYQYGNHPTWGQDADKFVRDWRVAGACLERVVQTDQMLVGQEPNGTYFADVCTSDREFGDPGEADNLPRAICEAYVRSRHESD